MQIVKNCHFYYLLASLAVAAVFSGCTKQLSADGVSSFGIGSIYIKSDSQIAIYSYKNSNPEYVTRLNPKGDAVIVPRTVLFPKLNFGVPENPLIYVNRTNPNNPTPLDLFLKVYSPSSDSPDFYFEIPVLGTPLVPTNVTTALSWVLRYSFNNRVVSLSYSQLLGLIEKIEVACSDCRKKSSTEVVSLILGDGTLTNAVVSTVRTSNPALGITSLNYVPAGIDYAWSNPALITNWEILSSLNEPTLSTDLVSLSVDVLFVSPANSTDRIKPNTWNHTAVLDESKYAVGTAPIQIGSVNGTPLNTSFDYLSSGIHTFTSQYSSIASAPLKVVASVLDQNRTPNCQATAVPSVMTNHILALKLDKTLATTLQNGSALRATEVAVGNISNLPSSASAVRYDIVFDTQVASPTVVYDAFRVPVDATGTQSGTVTQIAMTQTYVSGRSIRLTDNNNTYSLFISGVPVDTEVVSFHAPHRMPNNPVLPFIDGLGCADPDPSPLTGLLFTVSSDSPPGLQVSPTGNISWITDISDYNANPSHTASYRIFVTDSSGLTETISGTILLTEDSLPRACLNLDGPTNSCTAASAPARLPELPIAGYNELQNVQQNIFASDQDGDPVKITLSAISPTPVGALALLTDTTTFFTRITASGTQTLPTSSTVSYQYFWNYRPMMTQISGDTASGIIKARIDVTYDRAVNPNLSPSILASYPVDIVVLNTIDSPGISFSTVLARCGSSSCTTSSNPASYTARVYSVGFSAASTTATLINTKTGAADNSTAAGSQIFYEGEIATVKVPLIGRRRNPTAPVAPIMYYVDSFTSTCSFLKPGRIKFEESLCQAGDTEKNCLTLYLNYNTATGVQDPIPYFYTNNRCSFTLSTRDPQYPDTRTVLGGAHTVYIQDRNFPLALRPSAPTTLRQYLGRFAKEGETLNFMPFIRSTISDIELGARNTAVASTVTIVPPITERIFPSTVTQFDATDMGRGHGEIRAQFNGTVTVNKSNDNFASNVQNYGGAASNLVRQEVSGFIVELTAVGITGTINVQSNTTGNLNAPNWVNLANGNVRNLATFATGNNLAAGGRFFISTGGATQLRVYASGTAGTVSGTIIGNIMMDNSITASGTLFLLNSNFAGAPNFTTEIPISTTTTFGTGTYNFPYDPAAPFFRASNGTVTIASPLSDTFNSQYQYQCWIETPGPVFSACATLDSDGRANLPVDFGTFTNLITPENVLQWVVPYSYAVDGNSSATAINNPGSMVNTARVHLRIFDKGLLDTGAGLVPSTTCQSGSPFYSCVDHSFDIAAEETAAIPNLELLNDEGSVVNTWLPQTLGYVAPVPEIVVTEGSSRQFTFRLNQYSDHVADKYKINISSNENTPCSADALPGGSTSCNRSDGSNLLTATGSNYPIQLTTDLTSVTSDTVTFVVNPSKSTDGNSIRGATFRKYTYNLDYGVACDDPAVCPQNRISPTTTGRFSFVVKVNHLNTAPTAVGFDSTVPLDTTFQGIEASYQRCERFSQGCAYFMESGVMTVELDMSKTPTIPRQLLVPVTVTDADLLANGLPADNLTVNYKTGNSLGSITFANAPSTDAQPRTFIKINLSPSNCLPASNASYSESPSSPLTIVYSDGQVSRESRINFRIKGIQQRPTRCLQ